MAYATEVRGDDYIRDAANEEEYWEGTEELIQRGPTFGELDHAIEWLYSIDEGQALAWESESGHNGVEASVWNDGFLVASAEWIGGDLNGIWEWDATLDYYKRID